MSKRVVDETPDKRNVTRADALPAVRPEEVRPMRHDERQELIRKPFVIVYVASGHRWAGRQIITRTDTVRAYDPRIDVDNDFLD